MSLSLRSGRSAVRHAPHHHLATILTWDYAFYLLRGAWLRLPGSVRLPPLDAARYRTWIAWAGHQPETWLARAPRSRHDSCMSDPSPSAASEVPSPRLVGAWETLGLLPIERVPMWAAYWIVGGHDGEALARLAGLHGDDPREVHDALPDALRDCGVEMPDSDVAAATVAFTHAARL